MNARAAAKATAAIDRISRGLMTNVESVGRSVYERKVNFGPGYRFYFGSETDGLVAKIVILLNGGTKKGQSTDIDLAKQYWQDHKSRKRRGEK